MPTSGDDFDAAGVLARVDDDQELVVELIEIFRAGLPTLVSEIRRAVESGDARGVSFAAHSLKGALAALSAINATQAAHALELAGQSQQIADGVTLVANLETALVGAESAFAKFCATR